MLRIDRNSGLRVKETHVPLGVQRIRTIDSMLAKINDGEERKDVRLEKLEKVRLLP